MKVLHVCLNGPYTDGLLYQENILTKYQRKMGIEVIIIASSFCWDENGKIKKDMRKFYINNDRVRVYRLTEYFRIHIFNKVGVFQGMLKILYKEIPDVIFLHGCQYLECLKILEYVKKYPSTKLYVDNHCDFSNSARNCISKVILHKGLWRYCAKKLLPYVEKFYGVLPARVEFINQIYQIPLEKIEYLPLGADDELIDKGKENSETIRRKYKIKEKDFFVVTGGKIDTEKKETIFLMEAIKELKKYRVKLLIFGSVEDTLKKTFNKLLETSNITYVGWVKASESYNYFAAADLVVFPGRHSIFWEQVVGQGIPLLCKYWRGTTHVDIGGNCRFLYRSNKEEIKSQLLELIRNEKIYMSMFENAQGLGRKKFSYANIAEKSIK